MAMLTANEVLTLYPHGLRVFDATGRQLSHVMACNPETGEVIIWNLPDWIRWRLRRVKPRLRWDWLYSGSVHMRHGFWPAPLRLAPKDPWPGGSVPDGRGYIVGNGEREELL